MSNAKILLPQVDEMTVTDVLALQERKTIFPFNLSAKAIKVNDSMSLAEKYPYSIETSNGFVYQIVKDGGELATVQLSDLTGLDIKAAGNNAGKKIEPLLKIFFMDETRQLYTSLINQLTKLGNNQLFILCLGIKAQSLVKGEATTVNLISAPELRVIKSDQWIDLVVQVIKDVSWGYFDPDVRPAIIANFERKLREVVDVELKMLGVHIPSLEKAVNRQLKMITESTVDLTPEAHQPTDNLRVIQQVEDLPDQPFLTEDDLKLPTTELAEKIKQVSITAFEAFTAKLNKLKTPSQIRKYTIEKGWLMTVEQAKQKQETVEVETTETQEQ